MTPEQIERHQDGLSIELDPFGFWPDIASSIVGLGGAAKSHDPSYAFHTPYVPVPVGRAAFDIQFVGLRARRGTLVVRVNMLPDEPGSIARLVNSECVQLNRLVTLAGHVRIEFESFVGYTFAILGLIYENSDAEADDLLIRIDVAEPGTDQRRLLSDARSTAFGSDDVRGSAHLLSLDMPRLATPMSQPCTAAQLRQPLFAHWQQRLGETPAQSVEQWERVYVMQALDHYGMLQAGASGLGLVAAVDTVPITLAGLGVAVTLGLAADDIKEESTAGGIARRVLALPELPNDLVNFDFAWTMHRAEALATQTDAIAFLCDLMDSLRPGGVAVHLFRMSRAVDGRSTTPGQLVFDRSDIERLSMIMLAKGHDVARIRPGGPALPAEDADGTEGTITTFGLIARKARSSV